MEIPENISLDDLDNIKVVDDDGDVAACFGIVVTLYVDEPYRQAVREGAARCIEDYLAMAKPQLNKVAIQGGRIRKVHSMELPPMAELVAPLKETNAFEIIFTGAERLEDASPYSIETLLGRIVSYKDIGFLTATLPFGFLQQRPPGFFQHWVQRWCQWLSPYHGYAGLGLIRSVDYDFARVAGPYTYPIVKRFPGLEVDNPLSHSRHLADGIKGVNWLNVLSNVFVEKLGGQAALQARLGEEFPFYDYPGGVIIQAGPYPQLGDSERGEIPLHYQQLYSQVKPVQAEYPEAIIRTPQGVDKKAFAQEWLHRFK